MNNDRPLGFLVLTHQTDGSWQPDWDGILYGDRQDAEDMFVRAETVLQGGVMLVEVYPVGDVKVKTGLPSVISMGLCPVCGNKRCPKTTDNRWKCSGVYSQIRRR